MMNSLNVIVKCFNILFFHGGKEENRCTKFLNLRRAEIFKMCT